MSKTELEKRPSLHEFRQHVLNEYSDLIQHQGYREEESPADRYGHPFKIQLTNGVIVLIVEGINWGLNAATYIGRYPYSDDLSIRGEWSLPVWRLINQRRGVSPASLSKARRKRRQPGQLEQISTDARLLKEYGSDVIAGDLKAVDDLKRQEKEREAAARANAPFIVQRRADVAVTDAGHAFKRGEYHRVVELLEPHLALLPPSQRKRYEIACRHIGDSDGGDARSS